MEDPNQEKKSRLDLQPHYIEWGLTALGVIVACVLVVFVLFRMTIIWGVITKEFKRENFSCGTARRAGGEDPCAQPA